MRPARAIRFAALAPAAFTLIPANLTNAALVGIDFGKIDFVASLEELSLLAKSAGAHPAVTLTGRRSAPDAALFVGSGKADELRIACEANDIDLVIFNH